MVNENSSNVTPLNWSTVKSNIIAAKTTANSTITTKLTNLLSDSYIQGVANNNNEYILLKNAAKQAIRSAILNLETNVNDLQLALKQLLETQKVYAEEAGRIRNEIRTEQTELEKVQELNTIRKEQAESLHTKYEGNLHSSWLGLWIPLSDEFRVGILVTTLALFMSVFTIVGFLIYNGYIPAFWKRSTMGGSYMKKTRT